MPVPRGKRAPTSGIAGATDTASPGPIPATGRETAAADDGLGLVEAARQLARDTAHLQFSAPVACVYNPLVYAWPAHELYLRRFGRPPKRVVFVGMNPGPFGMVQTGVPFGEVSAVRCWLRIEAAVGRPAVEHPRRRITGFECPRSEVSGRRLWGLFKERFGQADRFFAEHLVVNYCPLAFVEGSGCNRTPDKLPGPERAALFAACDEHLRRVVAVLRPAWVIGIGDFATRRIAQVFPGDEIKRGGILHPSPANPAANRAWAAIVTRQLGELGIWA